MPLSRHAAMLTLRDRPSLRDGFGHTADGRSAKGTLCRSFCT
ncbi:MAG: hypothetical protein U0637_10425 [Phycisphaerales bacterium]